MKKTFSRRWISSVQPRKQRKYRYNAPLHNRQKMMGIHLDKSLRNTYKKRSLPARVGDEIVVTRGTFRKRTGKISDVDLKKLKVYVDSIKRKKVSGQEIEIPLDPSNLMITKLNLDDKKRQKFLGRRGMKETRIEKRETKEAKSEKPEVKEMKEVKQSQESETKKDQKEKSKK